MKLLKRLTVVAMVCVVHGGKVSGQTLTIIHQFGDSVSNGPNSSSGLVQGSDGYFYGTAAGSYPFPTTSTVFRISQTGSFTNLYYFSKLRNSNGTGPDGLMLGNDGNFYGTTVTGGNTNVDQGNGFGTVFRISSNGVFTSLYSFSGVPDGAFPEAVLVQGKDGNFYGTTSAGGVTTNGEFGFGTIFRISPSGTYTSLYSFLDYPKDGRSPNGLVQGSDGNFYGTAMTGGMNSCDCGTIFRISPSGTYTTLYSFLGFTVSGFGNGDGSTPGAGLVLGSDGNFYGTTLFGGVFSFQRNVGYGTIFRISPSGNYTSLYSFTGSPSDGIFPDAGLMQSSDGNLYGTTEYGGSNVLNGNCSCYGSGTVFRISPAGSYTNLYLFGSFAGDGAEPNAGLVQGGDGNFYGTTTLGGINNSGTVYRLSVPLNPPANQISSVQANGNNLYFSIPSIASETYQLQFTPDLTSGIWSNVPNVSVTNSIGAMLTLTNFGGAAGPQGFYRFDITP